MTTKIYFTSKSTLFSFCSNFYPYPFIFQDKEWATAEHAYQAMKSTNTNVQEFIRSSNSPSQAKLRGRNITFFKEDWEEVKVDYMKQILVAKFSEITLKKMLKDTGNIALVEYAPWDTDMFWGVNSDYNGANHLGKLLMEVRKSL